LVDISANAENSNNYTQCDSLLMGNKWWSSHNTLHKK